MRVRRQLWLVAEEQNQVIGKRLLDFYELSISQILKVGAKHLGTDNRRDRPNFHAISPPKKD